MSEIEGSDRYGGEANWPDPTTMCKGQCEGTGVIPVLTRGPIELESEPIFNDDFSFVTCPDCNGTGKNESRS